MKCSSKIKINQQAIRQLSRGAVRALEQTAEALHTEIVRAEVVPRDTGTLEGEGFFTDYSKIDEGTATLVHSTPYARRLYFHPEYNFHREPWTDAQGKEHDGNPNAKGKWFEDWMAGGKEANFAPDTFKELYRRNAGL